MVAKPKVLYVAHAHATGGRDGHAETDDKTLKVDLARPKELGGNGKGNNPEQLFAAGYSACFLGAMQFVASQEKTTVPADTTVSLDVGIGPIDHGFALDIDLHVKIPGWDKAKAEALVKKAHEVCPYSNATRNNVDVRLHVE
jgi:Ohr subfamily peroxiredoxin